MSMEVQLIAFLLLCANSHHMLSRSVCDILMALYLILAERIDKLMGFFA